MRPFPPGAFPRVPVLRIGLFGPVQLEIEATRISQTRCFVSVFLLSYSRLAVAFHLNMCALGERLGELRELAEDHATVPFGVRDVLVSFL